MAEENKRSSFKTKEFPFTASSVPSPPRGKRKSVSDLGLFPLQQTGTEQFHAINTVSLGAVVIIMMLRNKYDKLYKNIHLDNQL